MSLKSDAQAACRDALATIGFTERSRVFVRSAGEDADGLIGLSWATRKLPHEIAVNPVIGVRYRALEQLRRELQEDLPGSPLATISRPLGYLTRDKTYREWKFFAEGDCRAAAEELLAAIIEFGIPYIEEWSSWDRFQSRITEDDSLLLESERPIILALTKAVDGDAAAGRLVVEEELAKIGDASDYRSAEYRKFAQKFREKFKSI